MLPNGWTHLERARCHSNRCWTRPQTALAIATLFLSACAGVGSDSPPGACPPVVAYSKAEQARVADEVAALPEGAVIVGWLAIMRCCASRCGRASNQKLGAHVRAAHPERHDGNPRLPMRNLRHQVSLATAIWLQTMIPLTEGDIVKLQGYFWIADGSLAADHTSFWGMKVG